MATLYFDTNIFLDVLLERKNLYGKDISSMARKLFYDSIKCKHVIILSNWTTREIRKHIPMKQAKNFFMFSKKKIILISYTEADMATARKNNISHFQDELHGILAIKYGADYLVTRNVHDFKHFSDKIAIVKPEQLI